MKPKSAILLQEHYYLDHFKEVLGLVSSRYAHVLGAEHVDFIASFRALEREAQCLYVRMANRKGVFFIKDSLSYQDIQWMDRAVEVLREHDFLRAPTPKDYEGLLAVRTKNDLLTLVRRVDPASIRGLSSLKKEALVAWCASHFTFDGLFPPASWQDLLIQARVDELEYVLYLYFGRWEQGLSPLARRDLGVMATNPAGRSDFVTRFATREMAWTAFRAARLRHLLAQGTHEVAHYEAWLEEATAWPSVEDPEVQQSAARALYQLGLKLESVDRAEAALRLYRQADAFPATERAVRLLFRMGAKEEAEDWLKRMIDHPSCDEELLFAEDYYERKFHRKRTGRLTLMLREAKVLTLDETGRDCPEASAVAWFRRQGGEAGHTENELWAMLFGLWFWELLYVSTDATWHSEFDRVPAGLNSDGFRTRCEPQIRQRLAGLDDPVAAVSVLQGLWKQYQGAPTTLFRWDETLFAFVLRLVAWAPAGALATVLETMTQHRFRSWSGFPDLMVLRDEQVSFVEIKTEGDQLQRHQLARLELLKRAGFSVEVNRICWALDPEQDYVVVDVETTGGKPQWDRLTEIAAIRVHHGEIVEEWHHLIHPNRRIPSSITRLTGITDAMVEDAPPFSEVADELRAFLDGAVLVAHRATFDYQFLRAEYRRLGEELTAPVMCTLAGMRRHYPGLSSYGLARLCQHFGIPLESHHRALHDARATVSLLQLINHKRAESMVSVSQESDG